MNLLDDDDWEFVYEEQPAQWYEILWDIVVSLTSGIGFIVLAGLAGYLITK